MQRIDILLVLVVFVCFGPSLCADNKKNVLIIDASDVDKAVFADADLTDIKKRFKDIRFDGVLSAQDYLGNIAQALIAEQYVLSGSSVQSILRCQHKYYGRCAQKKHVPQAVPQFGLVDPQSIDTNIEQLPLSFPFFVKPIKAYFSFGANKTPLYQHIRDNMLHWLPSIRFLKPFDAVLKAYGYQVGINSLLAEERVGSKHVTREGCVHNSDIIILGITDSIMYPRTISFQPFEYLGSLSQRVQRRMRRIAQTYMNGH